MSDTTLPDPLPADLNDLTQKQLLALCEQRGVEASSSASKSDLIKLLEAAPTVPEVTPPPPAGGAAVQGTDLPATQPPPATEPPAPAEPADALEFADDQYLVAQLVAQGSMLLGDDVLGDGSAVPSFLIEAALRADGKATYSIEEALDVIRNHASIEETA